MKLFIIMGVSGCGKSTVGELLATNLNAPFYDADDYHPQANIDKMASAIPLNDDDRAPWLARLHALLAEHAQAKTSAVLACSALKKSYRTQLRGDLDTVEFVYLAGRFELILQRLNQRQGHYMRPELLQSQFDTLELPTATEALTLSIEHSAESLTQQIMQHFY